MPPEDNIHEVNLTPTPIYKRIAIKDLIVRIKEDSQETNNIILSIRNYLKSIVHIDETNDLPQYTTIDKIQEIENIGVLLKDLLIIQEYNLMNMEYLCKLKNILTNNFGEDDLPF